jgi:hypothetical protein
MTHEVTHMKLDTREIPRSEWRAFFDQFSRLHHGQPLGVEIIGRDVGVQREAQDLPLLGVTAESPAGAGAGIEVSAGRPGGPHVTHSVADPVRVWAAEWNDGVSASLEIESADGHKTLLRVGPAQQVLPPGMITDGLYQRGQS